jgi:hypothetical protein
MTNYFAKNLVIKQTITALVAAGLNFSAAALSADDEADTEKPSAKTTTAPAKPKPATPPKAEKPAAKEPVDTEQGDTAATKETKEPAKPVAQKSQTSKNLDNRLSLGTSVGWAAIKPAKGTWIGLGASDINLQWRMSQKDDGKLFITGRYAPFAGVWTVNRRDYDTTLHGFYAGAEFQAPTSMLGGVTLKGGVEVGYMLVYAKAQDKAAPSGDVKGGKASLTAGGGADWSILSNKVKVGPFARAHVGGFSIFNFGGSARFVF